MRDLTRNGSVVMMSDSSTMISYPLAALAIPLVAPSTSDVSAQDLLAATAQALTAKISTLLANTGGSLVAHRLVTEAEAPQWLGFVAFYPGQRGTEALQRAVEQALGWSLMMTTRFPELAVGVALETQHPSAPMTATQERGLAHSAEAGSRVVVHPALFEAVSLQRYEVVPVLRADAPKPLAYRLLSIRPQSLAEKHIEPTPPSAMPAKPFHDPSLTPFIETLRSLQQQQEGHAAESPPVSMPLALSGMAVPQQAQTQIQDAARHEASPAQTTLQMLPWTESIAHLMSVFQTWATDVQASFSQSVSPSLMVLRGAVGVGKRTAVNTALQVAFASENSATLGAIPPVILTLEAQSSVSGWPTPYRFWARWLRLLLNLPEGIAPENMAQPGTGELGEAQADALRKALLDIADQQLAQWMPEPLTRQTLLQLANVGKISPSEQISSDSLTAASLSHALRVLIAGVSAHQPLITVIDDVDSLLSHDLQSLAVLRELITPLTAETSAESLSLHACLFVMTSAATGEQEAAVLLNTLNASKAIRFQGYMLPMTLAEVPPFVDVLLQQAGISPQAHQFPPVWISRLHEATQGLPFALDEALRYTMATQQVQVEPLAAETPGQDPQYHLRLNAPEPSLPEGGLHGLLQAKWHLLGDYSLRYAICLAACFGVHLPLSGLQVLLQESLQDPAADSSSSDPSSSSPEAQFEQTLHTLWQHGWLLPGALAGTASFRHPLLASVAYQSLPTDEIRLRIHQLVYRYYEMISLAGALVSDDMLADAATHAHLWPMAAHWLLQAIERQNTLSRNDLHTLWPRVQRIIELLAHLLPPGAVWPQGVAPLMLSSAQTALQQGYLAITTECLNVLPDAVFAEPLSSEQHAHLLRLNAMVKALQGDPAGGLALLQSSLDVNHLVLPLTLALLTAEADTLEALLTAFSNLPQLPQSDENPLQAPSETAQQENVLRAAQSLRALAHGLMLQSDLSKALMTPMISSTQPAEAHHRVAHAFALLITGQPQAALATLPNEADLAQASPLWQSVAWLATRLVYWAHGFAGSIQSRHGQILPVLSRFPLLAAIDQVLDQFINPSDVSAPQSQPSYDLPLWIVALRANASAFNTETSIQASIQPLTPLVQNLIHLAAAHRALDAVESGSFQDDASQAEALTRAGRQLEGVWKTASQSGLVLFQALTARLITRLYRVLAASAPSAESRSHYEARQRAFERQASVWTPWHTTPEVILGQSNRTQAVLSHG